MFRIISRKTHRPIKGTCLIESAAEEQVFVTPLMYAYKLAAVLAETYFLCRCCTVKWNIPLQDFVSDHWLLPGPGVFGENVGEPGE